LVACGWFGIQTWIGGSALAILAAKLFPSVALPQFLPGWFGIGTGELIAFVAFWLMNVAIIVRGIDALKVFETLAAPFLLLMGLLLFIWAWVKVPGGFGAMMADSSAVGGGSSMSTFGALGIGITGAVAFWGTLALNIPDFTRYAKSQRDQAVGQAISLPTTMTFYVFIGAAVTNATVLIFGERISDPVKVLSQVGGPVVVIIALVGLIIATISTNLAANVVSPANGFASLLPQKINFRKGALIAAGIGLVIFPWKMWNDPDAYIMTWLGGCGSLLGAVGGIMIADYFLIRKTELNVKDLYRRGGEYEYARGINTIGVSALLIGIAPLIPGFLASIKAWAPPAFFLDLYKWSWFVAFLLAGAVYVVGMTLLSKRK